MPFKSFEAIPTLSFERGPERVRNYLEALAEKLRKYDFPVTPDCRIDMEAEMFRKLYPPQEIQRDLDSIRELEEKWKKEGKKRELSFGERGERLVTALLDKYLGSKFYVLRTSLFDDEKHPFVIHGIDNILIEKETGNPVCATDEVTDIGGERYRQKKKEVLELNLRGGGMLKYGIELKPGKEKPEITPAKLRELPVFYICIPPNILEMVEEKFKPSLEESEDEKKLLTAILTSIHHQIYGFKGEKGLISRDLLFPPNFRRRLYTFAERLEEIKKDLGLRI